jgi:hypothetical protein
MQALHIHAGPRALAHIRQQGLAPADVRLVPAAAGGPKGLILTHLDRHLFGRWLPQADETHRLDLVGASIGAWRMAAALMPDPAKAFDQLAQVYISQRYDPEPGRKRPSPQRVSSDFAKALDSFFTASLADMLAHPRWRLHMVTSRGRGLLRRAGPLGTLAGFAGLVLGNAVSRRAVGSWLERTVFSVAGQPPFKLDDQPTRVIPLSEQNFLPALQASCSIPFVLDPVHDIPGCPTGAHWDGGIVDYHFHWPFASAMSEGVVLYPHFQQQVIPGWLDKAFKSRHRPTPALDNMVLLAPNPGWVATLPGGKLPDRNDFKTLDNDTRIAHWRQAVSECQKLADEWQGWLDQGCPADRVKPL